MILKYKAKNLFSTNRGYSKTTISIEKYLYYLFWLKRFNNSNFFTTHHYDIILNKKIHLGADSISFNLYEYWIYGYPSPKNHKDFKTKIFSLSIHPNIPVYHLNANTPTITFDIFLQIMIELC